LIGLLGGVLLGLGSWMERRRDSIAAFGAVLLAGGTATLYFTAFAAHHVQALRIIQDPTTGGTWLLAVSCAILWFACQRKSEPTAMLVILLSYYVGTIHPISEFTLFSALLLTVGAVLCLIRHPWTKLPYVALIASYGSYLFWQTQKGQTAAEGNLVLYALFLLGYWIIFSAALISPASRPWSPNSRSTFATLNNLGVLLLLFPMHRNGLSDYSGHLLISTGLCFMILDAIVNRSAATQPTTHRLPSVLGAVGVLVGAFLATPGTLHSLLFIGLAIFMTTISKGKHGVEAWIAVGCAVLACCVELRQHHLTDPEWLLASRVTLPVGCFVLTVATAKLQKKVPHARNALTLSWHAAVSFASLAIVIPPRGEFAFHPLAIALCAIITFSAGLVSGVWQFAAAARSLPLWLLATALLNPMLTLTPECLAGMSLTVAICVLSPVIARLRWPSAARHQTSLSGSLPNNAIPVALIGCVVTLRHVPSPYEAAVLCLTASVVVCLALRDVSKAVPIIVALATGAIALGVFAIRLLAPDTAVLAALTLIAAFGMLVAALQNLKKRIHEQLTHSASLTELCTLLEQFVFIAIWILVTRWGLSKDAPVSLTLLWALFGTASIVFGLSLRAREYRIAGLAGLSLALVRLIAIDVSQLDGNYRIASFIGLGCALLGISFFYHRFHAAISKILREEADSDFEQTTESKRNSSLIH
jgi:hypothetical protein